jgi:hypothetical protein
MAKGLTITDQDKIEIKLIWEKLKQTQEKVSAEAVRKEAERVIGRPFGRSTVHSVISLKPKDETQFAFLDNQFSLGIVANLAQPLPHEIVPILLAIQENIAKGKMSIREAQWVVRLSGIYFNVRIENAEFSRINELWVAAQLYARYQHSCDDAGVPCHTDEFDCADTLHLKEKLLAWFKGKITNELFESFSKGDK